MDNLFDFFAQFAESHRMTLAGGLGLLALLQVALRRRGKTAQRSEAPATAARVLVPAPEVRANPPTIMEPPTEGAIHVDTADPVGEAEVFLAFGYFDRAGEALRPYVDGAGRGDRRALRKLLTVYQQTRRIDDFADILERLWQAGEDSGFIREAVVAGLAIDRHNLQLRVLAESGLKLGPEQIAALLEPEAEPARAAAPKPAPKPRPATTAAPRPVPAAQQSAQTPASPCLRLVTGETPMPALSSEERFVVRAFLPPLREARLHLAMGDTDAAVSALRRAITCEPKGLTSFTEILQIFYVRRDLAGYARELWRLFLVLEGNGRPLRERLLGRGFALGHHPLLEALAQAEDRRQLEAIGRQFGLLQPEAAPPRRLQLIEAAQGIGQAAEEQSDRVLEEVNAYLEFGQVEEAVAALEAAILEHPLAAHLYPPLLDLYDRMDELARLVALTTNIKKRVPRPPEEVVPMMHNLHKRLKERKQQIAA